MKLLLRGNRNGQLDVIKPDRQILPLSYYQLLLGITEVVMLQRNKLKELEISNRPC